MTQSRLDPGVSCVSSCAQPVFLPSLLCTRCFAFARIGFSLPGMSIATSRHEPPRYDQAGHGNDQADTAMSRPEMVLLVLLVNDSEYSRSTVAKPILSLSCMYLVSPGARCCCCGSCRFLLLLLRAPTPPRPPFLGGGKYQKNKITCSVGVGGWVCWRVRGRGGGRDTV